jgi:hypothetical protein
VVGRVDTYTPSNYPESSAGGRRSSTKSPLRSEEIMRAPIVVALIAAAFPLLQACAGSSAEPVRAPVTSRAEPDFSALPTDEKALSDLNSRQRRMIRRAQTRCAAEGGGVTGGPCVMGNVDREVARENDPALTAFHYALPMQHRYDSDRASFVWKNVHNYVPQRAGE